MKAGIRWMAFGLLVLAAGSVSGVAQSVVPDRVDIEDADTLLVTVAGREYRIQLPYIDAPENVMNPKLQRDIARTGLTADALLPLGVIAGDGLKELLETMQGYRLVFDPDSSDRYGRTPGDLVDEQGRALSVLMVEAGYAIPVQAPAHQADGLQRAFEQAQRLRLGLWGTQRDIATSWAAPATDR